ncbi:hypothetical protein [Bradyrhizobium sp. 169]|uniref:hypothetical protein n=1 Tax=Bradyrhizobium sp. 169 TaxID=2782640 RepID=UPI001FF71219|nr:hypothetical protein [Bradyrhizobium sp. 169]MCK1587735.1 hypothetical protein [Bradyrhizobium sp. 169]
MKRPARLCGVRDNSKQQGRAPNPIVAWLCFVGVLFPGGLVASNALGPKLTVGRGALLLLVLPALIRLGKSYRRLIVADYLMGTTAVWMIGVAAYVGGTESMSSAGAQATELAGAYFVARGFFLGPEAVAVFIRALKGTLAIVVLLGIADTLSGRLFIHEALARLANSAPLLAPDFRINLVRAASTFDHPILFGTFCTISGVILMGSETKPAKWIKWVGISGLGCFVALSSGPLLSLLIALGAYAYDRSLKQFPWRGSLFWTLIVSLVIVLFAVTNRPVAWIITNLTLDPVSGWFRLMIWDLALARIDEQPFTGFAFLPLNDYILDYTVDSVWLQLALRFGLPMIAMLILVNISTVIGDSGAQVRGSEEVDTDRLKWGFSAAVVMLMLTGLTVHYWHFVWIFWGLCLGIRGSLRESSLTEGPYPAAQLVRFPDPIAELPQVRSYGRS